MSNIFDTMTKKEAIGYCHEHANEYKSDLYADGINGERHFDCLIELLKSDTITGADLPEYGMNYERIFPDHNKEVQS